MPATDSDADSSRPTDEQVDLLLIEDNLGDARLVREAFAETESRIAIEVTTDGEEAIEFLARRGDHRDASRPDLILLDLNLPKKDGRDVLAEIKADSDLRRIPVIVLSSSTNDEDINDAYDQHANAYLTKPVDPTEFVSMARTLEAFWLSLTELPSGR